MVRVTDASTRPDYPNRQYASSASSEQNIWNTNSTLFYVEGSGGEIIPIQFDPASMKVSRLGPPRSLSGGTIVPLRASPTFSFVDPDLMYGSSPTSPPMLQSYRFSSGSVTTLHDPSGCLKVAMTSYGRDVSVSGDDRRLGTWFGGSSQDTDILVYVYDKQRGCRWWNTQTGEIGGEWGPKGRAVPNQSFLVHVARISKDGRYMRVSVGTPGINKIFFWDLETLDVNPCSTEGGPVSCQGHVVMGYNTLINQRSLGDGPDYAIRPLDDLSKARPLIYPVLTPPEYANDSHPSWNNARPDALVPVCTSVYREDGAKIRRPWDNEIVCMRTDGPSQVSRFAHTRSTNSDWNTRPRGNISQDGKFFIFHSDWMNTTGKRTDVFIVELK